MPNNFANELERALTSMLGQGTRKRGRLGYKVQGSYAVVVPNDFTKFYVRLETGELVRAVHKSRVSPQPDLDVIVLVPDRGPIEILDVDWDRALYRFRDYAGALGIGLHTHQRFSGMEFPIDPRLFQHLRMSWTGLVVTLKAGWYQAGDVNFWWAGTDTVDLTPDLPTPGYHRWTLICLDTTTDPADLVTVPVDEVVVATDLEIPDLVDPINALERGLIPIAAAKLESTSTGLNERDVEALPALYRSKSRYAAIETSDQDLGDPPSDDDFDLAFGEDLEEGFAGLVDDGGTGDAFWLAMRKSGTWVMVQMIEAISPPLITVPASDDTYVTDLDFDWEFD